MKTFFFAFFCYLIFPCITHAQVIISEIMYDPAGADGGYEWVEVQNTSASGINLTAWKLLENGVNHRVNEFQGGAQIGAGLFAIIADNPANFLLAYPNYTGLLFDSAFSLNNTGELIAMIDENVVTVDAYTYAADPAADGTGDTLQLHNASWAVGSVTPGAQNNHTPTQSTTTDNGTTGTGTSSGSGTGSGSSSGGTTTTTSTSQTGNTTAPPPKSNALVPPYFDPYYTGAMTTQKNIVAGVETLYTVEITWHRHMKEDTEKNKGYYVWNMGDGMQYAYTWNDPVHHTYEYPGNYIVFLEWYTGKSEIITEPTMVFEKTIQVHAPDIQIVEYTSDGGIGVKNNTKFSFDISDWVIESMGITFRIPPKTYLPAGETRYFPRAITKFDHLHTLNNKVTSSLLYPNGKVLHVYDPVAVARQKAVEAQKVQDEMGDEEESVTESGIENETQTITTAPPIRSDLSAAALFSQESNTNGSPSLNMPWWLWIILGASILASIASVVLSQEWFFKKESQKEGEQEEEQEGEEKEE